MCIGIWQMIPLAKQGAFRRIWNWPFKIGLGSWLLGFLLQLIPHTFTVSVALFEVGLVSLIVFVIGFLITVSHEKPAVPLNTSEIQQ